MSRIQELQELIRKSQLIVNEAKEEGDLRENSSYIDEVSKLARYQKELMMLKNIDTEEQLKYPWQPPTEVGNIIVMGVKIYHEDYDKPLVILPSKSLITYLYQRTDFLPCSSKSEVAFKLLGRDITELYKVTKIELWRDMLGDN